MDAPKADTGVIPLPKKFVVCEVPNAAGLLAPPKPVLPNEPNVAGPDEANPPKDEPPPSVEVLPKAFVLAESVVDDDGAAEDTDVDGAGASMCSLAISASPPLASLSFVGFSA